MFSIEHFLTTKLVEKYNSYQGVRAVQASKGLDHRLAVLYNSLDELKAKTWSDEDRDFQEQRMRSYQEEIRLLREEKDDESLRERELIHDILGLWKTLKQVRSKQGFSNTNHKIIVHKVGILK